MFEKAKILTAKDAKSFRKERNVLKLTHFFFVSFAKNFVPLAVKTLLSQPQQQIKPINL
jgi:hypothetical protein